MKPEQTLKETMTQVAAVASLTAALCTNSALAADPLQEALEAELSKPSVKTLKVTPPAAVVSSAKTSNAPHENNVASAELSNTTTNPIPGKAPVTPTTGNVKNGQWRTLGETFLGLSVSGTAALAIFMLGTPARRRQNRGRETDIRSTLVRPALSAAPPYSPPRHTPRAAPATPAQTSTPTVAPPPMDSMMDFMNPASPLNPLSPLNPAHSSSPSRPFNTHGAETLGHRAHTPDCGPSFANPCDSTSSSHVTTPDTGGYSGGCDTSASTCNFSF